MTQISWYAARSAGMMAWVLLTASVVWGLLLSTRVLGRRPRANWLLDLHRYLGGLATVFVGVHVLAIVADSYVSFGLADVLVPFASSWKPAAVAWGVVGLYLLVAIEVTSLVRGRLPKQAWHAVHLASFPLFAMATIHGLTAGTDGRAWLFEGSAVVALLVVSGLAAVRFAGEDSAGAGAGPRPAAVGVARRL